MGVTVDALLSDGGIPMAGSNSNDRSPNDRESNDWGEGVPTVRCVAAAAALPSLTHETDAQCDAQTVLTKPPPSSGLLAGAALPISIRASLQAVNPQNVPSYELTTTRTVMGRGPNANIRIDDEKASRKHASIVFVGDEFRIRDEGSSNGTFLNGSRVVEYALRNGDEVLIGLTLYRFNLE
jgi:pSer/pThr/pTyr-binding forkhead associated (FHA) protein